MSDLLVTTQVPCAYYTYLRWRMTSLTTYLKKKLDFRELRGVQFQSPFLQTLLSFPMQLSRE